MGPPEEKGRSEAYGSVPGKWTAVMVLQNFCPNVEFLHSETVLICFGELCLPNTVGRAKGTFPWSPTQALFVLTPTYT